MTFVYLSSYSTAVDAHIVKGRLESEGIDVQIRDQHLVTMHFFYSHAVGGVKLYVSEDDFEKACSLIGKDNQIEPESTAGGAWGKCPQCESENVEFQIVRYPTLIGWLLAGIPLLFPRKRLHCLSCEHDWPFKK